ncbi:MAG: Large ATP-binding protein [Streptosporangiaceae bacterium]|jgi:predicted NACHT family NTPase|nr:Large ATP-binding protein [Streptosporangiaceae bacterium]
MAIDSGGNPRLGPVLLALAAAVPPALGGVGLWGTVQGHPVQAAGALLTYEVLVVLAGILVQAHGELRKHWAARFPEAVDAALRRRFSRYGRRYRRFLAEAHRDIDLRGPWARGALTMDHLFVDIDLVPRSDATGADAGPPGSVWGFLRSSERTAVTIIGAAGGGKTTLLKHLTLVLAGNRRAGWPVGAPRHKTPILLFLREHGTAIAADPAISLPELVRRSARFARAVEPPRWFDQQLETGRCVVLLDGLDEVAREEDRRAIADWVERQVGAYPGCRFALTSRSYGGDAGPPAAALTVRIDPFGPGQAALLLHRWYAATGRRAVQRGDGAGPRAGMAQELLGGLRAGPGPSELAASPLLLTMSANVHAYRGTLAGSRTRLYGEFFQVLLGRRSDLIGTGQELTLAQKKDVLGVLAWHLMEHEVRDIAPTAAADVIAPVLAGVRPQMDPQDFLASVERTTGLLLERENGLYCFAHRSLQEYLAASYLAGSARPEPLIPHLGRDWWRETTLFYAAQADASPLVTACLDQGALSFASELADRAWRLDPELGRRVAKLLER